MMVLHDEVFAADAEGHPALQDEKETTGVTVTPDDGGMPSQLNSYSSMAWSNLDCYIKERVEDCTKLYEAVNKKASELLPALLEMESRFVKQERARTDLHELFAQGWHKYLESCGIKPATFRKWKSRSATMKQLHAMVEPPKPSRRCSSGSRDGGYSGGGRINDRPSDLMAKAGVGLAKTFLNPLLTESERMAKAKQQAEELVEADASGNYEVAVDISDDDVDGTESCVMQNARHLLAPPLTRMTALPVSSQDADEALLEAAKAAAITAANAVSEADINCRYRPRVMFYTNRQTVMFGRMLKKQGIKSYSHRGKTCYDFPTIPAYRTYEEAWAYASSFATALPGLNIAYGVRFEHEEKSAETAAICGYNPDSITLISRGEPPSHGG